jgi:hypothetical protein
MYDPAWVSGGAIGGMGDADSAALAAAAANAGDSQGLNAVNANILPVDGTNAHDGAIDRYPPYWSYKLPTLDLTSTKTVSVGSDLDWPGKNILQAIYRQSAANLFTLKYKWAFYTATCYIKLWWNERRIDSVYGASEGMTALISKTVTNTGMMYEWTPDGDSGLCIPAGCNLNRSDFGDFNGGEATWPTSDVFEPDVNPADPSDNQSTQTEFLLTNLRYSLLPGYESDPQYAVDNKSDYANGFPPAD